MFYPSAKVILKYPHDNSRILLIKRLINGKYFYEPAGGKLEIDFTAKKAENLEECAIREAKEELGVTIKINNYVGSYYFFWSIDPNKCSSCAVFSADIIEADPAFTMNADECELETEPAWVTLEDLKNKKITFDQNHNNLETLIMGYVNTLL